MGPSNESDHGVPIETLMLELKKKCYCVEGQAIEKEMLCTVDSYSLTISVFLESLESLIEKSSDQ